MLAEMKTGFAAIVVTGILGLMPQQALGQGTNSVCPTGQTSINGSCVDGTLVAQAEAGARGRLKRRRRGQTSRRRSSKRSGAVGRRQRKKNNRERLKPNKRKSSRQKSGRSSSGISRNQTYTWPCGNNSVQMEIKKNSLNSAYTLYVKNPSHHQVNISVRAYAPIKCNCDMRGKLEGGTRNFSVPAGSKDDRVLAATLLNLGDLSVEELLVSCGQSQDDHVSNREPTPPPSTRPNPPQKGSSKKNCILGMEKWGGRCRKACKRNQVRNNRGRCVRDDRKKNSDKNTGDKNSRRERPKPPKETSPGDGRCRSGMEKWQGRCKRVCRGNKIRNSQGRCVRKPGECRSGQERWKGQCKRVCRNNKVRNSKGRCVRGAKRENRTNKGNQTGRLPRLSRNQITKRRSKCIGACPKHPFVKNQGANRCVARCECDTDCEQKAREQGKPKADSKCMRQCTSKKIEQLKKRDNKYKKKAKKSAKKKRTRNQNRRRTRNQNRKRTRNQNRKRNRNRSRNRRRSRR